MSHRTRVPLIASAIALAAAISLSACGGAGQSTAVKDASATLLLPTGFTSLDPDKMQDAYSRILGSFLYDRLIGVDPKTGETVSNLASSWTITSKKAHFVIKDGITCSDGSKFTAATAVRNLERMKDSGAAYLGSGGYTVAAGADGKSIDVNFVDPLPFAANKFAAGPEFVCDSGLDHPDELEQSSAGTGPYVLKNATTGENYVLERRDDYSWGLDGATSSPQMPKTLTVKFVADADSMANLVISGDADIALLAAQQVARVKQSNEATVIPAYSAVQGLFFNHRPDHLTSSQTVRTALAQAVSATDYTSASGLGVATPAESITPENTPCSAWGKMDNVTPSGGPSAAARTLDADGWAKNSSGVWEKDGTPLKVRLSKVEVPDSGLEYVRSVLSDLGVDVTVDTRTGSEATEALLAGKEWDVSIVSYASATPPITLTSGPTPPTGRNFAAIDNSSVNADIAQMLASNDEGCPHWIKAERETYKAVDFFPLMVDEASYVSLDWDLGVGPDVYFPIPTDLKQH